MVKEVEYEWTDRLGNLNRKVDLVEEELLEDTLAAMVDAGYTILEVRDQVEPAEDPLKDIEVMDADGLTNVQTVVESKVDETISELVSLGFTIVGVTDHVDRSGPVEGGVEW